MMNTKKKIGFATVLAFLAAMIFVPLPVLAQRDVPSYGAPGGKIRMGNFKIIPTLALQGMYDDNIYLGNGTNNTTERKESDWIAHVKPGLLINYTIPQRGYVNVGYSGDWAFYDKNDKNNWKNQQGNVELNYLAPVGLVVVISNAYTRAEDPYGSADQYGIGRVTKRWYDDLKLKMGYYFSSSLRAFAFYNFYAQEYKNIIDFSQNYRDQEGGAGVEAKFMPKTWGFLRYHHGMRDYTTQVAGAPESRDSGSTWHRVNAGLTWDAARARITGELNFGYQWKRYDNELTPTGGRRHNKDTWIASTSVNYSPTTTTLLTLNISRALRDTGSDTSEYFEDTGVNVLVQQTILRKFILSAGAAYSKNDYNLPETNPREDDNYLANVSLDYKIRDWLTAGVGYTYNKKDSNYDENSFEDNRVMFMVSFVY